MPTSEHCAVCGQEFYVGTSGEIVDDIPLCSGCKQDIEEVEEDAAASPYEEVQH
jgi:hypothetical protein